MKKSLIIALSLILVFSFAFTGCGAGTSQEPNAPEKSKTEEKAPDKTSDKPSDKPVKFQLVNWGNPAHQEMLKSIVDNYKKDKPNVTIELVQASYGEFTEKVTTMIASGNPPDITWWSEDSFKYFADKGYFMELDDAISQWGAEWDKDDFYPNMLEEGKYKGKQYGIPFSTPAHVLFYNKKLFDEAKIKYPDENWTWDDLVSAAKAMTKGEGANKVYGITNLLDKGKEWQNLLDIMRPYGGTFMSDDRSRCTINSEENKKALELYMELQKGGFTTKHNANAPFEQGKAAMFLGYLSYNGAFSKAADLDYDIAYLPKGPKGRMGRAGYANYVVMKTTKYPKESLEFMKFITSKEMSKVQSKLFGPARKSVGLASDYMADVPKPKSKEIFIKSLEFCKPTENFPQFKNANTVTQEEFEKMFYEKQSVQETLANIEKRVNEIVGAK